MASDAPKKRGRPSGTTKRKEGDKSIRVTLSARQHAYLCWLQDNTYQGATANLILHKLIAEKFEEMDPSPLKMPRE